MTKAELIALLTNVADDTEILIESWPETGDPRGPGIGDLFNICATSVHESDKSGSLPFVVLTADVEFLN